MARNTTKRPAPTPTAPVEVEVAGNPMTDDTLTAIDQVIDNVVSLERRKDQGPETKSRGPVLETRRLSTDIKEAAKLRLDNRHRLLSVVTQRLAEASDLYSQGDAKSAEAQAIASEAARKLYEGRAASVITSDELTQSLGNVFGFKAKADGTASKTPNVKGEAIRKRVVRAWQASECLAGRAETAGRFFDGLDGDSMNKTGYSLEDAVNALNAGDITIWRAYDLFAEIKRDHTERTDPAFDPKRIAKMVASLSDEGAAAIYRNSPALIAAYAALTEIVTMLDTVEVEAA